MGRAEILETLACDYGTRPIGAPTAADVLSSVRGIRRDGAALLVEFDTAAAESVAAFVDAERRCCSTIGWELTTQPIVCLRLTATPSQIEALEQMFSPPES